MIYTPHYDIFCLFTTCHSCRIEIMMGCGNKLVKPVLSRGQSLSGYLLSKIFGSKAICLRPSRNLVDIKVKILAGRQLISQTIQKCRSLDRDYKSDSLSSSTIHWLACFFSLIPFKLITILICCTRLFKFILN